MNSILLVDDDTAFVQQVRSLGEQLLIRVRPVDSPAGALEVVDRLDEPVDAIFVNADICADLSAREFVEGLRARWARPPLPLAFLSDRASVGRRVQAARLGALLVLDKPVDTGQLLRAVHQLVALSRAGSPSVLIVDDDAAFVQNTRQLLETNDMVVAHLGAGDDILAKLERADPDALIINARMPHTSGFDLCHMLRTIPRWQDVPVVFVAHTATLDTRLDGFQAGGDDLLAKPVAPQELLACVQVHVNRARLMRQRADRDLLTGLLTRRALLEALAARVSEVTRNGRHLSFCLIDLDHFKAINDRHGHVVGDRVLAGLGRLLQNHFRVEDLRGRWGGEEFAVAIVNEQAPTAADILRRAQAQFETMSFAGADRHAFGVTFSAGIAQFPDDGHDIDRLVNVADTRLYAAKAAGRNRIVYAADVLPQHDRPDEPELAESELAESELPQSERGRNPN